MIEKKNIGILTDQFINWGGGVDFIRLILNGLSSLNKKNIASINIIVFVPKSSTITIEIKNSIKSLLNIFLNKKLPIRKTIGNNSIIELFKGIDKNIDIVFYDSTDQNLSKQAIEKKIDFLLPAFNPLRPSFPVKWAGYIYDFQHMYYPEFFTNQEIARRNAQFDLMLNRANMVVVNAISVKNDIEKFFPTAKAEIFALPFCPVVNSVFFDNDVAVAKYQLPDNYFLISNQFWKHKDHPTAFKAFKLFLEGISSENCSLVCTGQIHDERFPHYYDDLMALIKELGLGQRIKILGYIPKIDQLNILKRCIGVIQPTLFEGGPGGGAVYESVAYGVPSIVSNIQVNKELVDETVTFFQVGSAEDLSKKMKDLFLTPRKHYSREELIAKNEISLIEMGQKILSLIS